MTTPVVPVFQDYFGGASWSDDWTQSAASGVPAATFSIVSGKGRITPGLPAFTPSNDKILYAAAWKDSNLKSFSLTATMDKSTYDSSLTAVGWGILFAWDGNINSPSGYMLHSIKGNDGIDSTGLRVSKLTTGTFDELSSIAFVNASEQTVTLRVTPTGVTNLIQFTTTSYGWASVTDSTYMTGGQVAIVSYRDATAYVVSSVDDDDWISVKDLTLNRLGSSATGVTPGTGTEGAPYISGSPTSLVQGSSTVGATSYTTASIVVPTPSGSGATVTNTGPRLYLAFFSTTYATAGPAAVVPTMSGAGLTWSRYNGVLHSSTRRIDVYQAYGIATQSAALTFTSTSQMTSGIWFVVEVYGAADGSSLTLPTANLPSIASGGTANTPTLADAATVTLSCGTYLPDVSPHALTIMGVSIPATATTADQFTAGAFTTELGELVQTGPNHHFGLFYAVSPSAPTLTATWLASSNYGAAGVMIQPSVKYPPLDGCTASMGGIG